MLETQRELLESHQVKAQKRVVVSDRQKMEKNPRIVRKSTRAGAPMGSPETASMKSLPNYMKHTRSSAARKESSLISPPLFKSNKRRNPLISNYLNLSSASGYGCKSLKIVTKKSVKLVRPPAKENSGVPFESMAQVNTATFSSSQRASKLPRELNLKQRGKEPDGNPVLKVCRYDNCSLNCRKDHSLPPVKSFSKAKRNLLQTQKSMKVKGVSPFRKQGRNKDVEENNNIGQCSISKASCGIETAPLFVEYNDFYVEINAKPHPSPEITQADDEDYKSEMVLFSAEDANEAGVIDDGDVRSDMNQIVECHLGNGTDDVDAQNSEISEEELDAMANFVEYIECEQEFKEYQEEDKPGLEVVDIVESSLECTKSNKEDQDEGESDVSIPKVADPDCNVFYQYSDKRSSCSGLFDDELGGTEAHSKMEQVKFTHAILEKSSELPHVASGFSKRDKTVVSDASIDGNQLDVAVATPAVAKTNLCFSDHSLTLMNEELGLLSRNILNSFPIPLLSEEVPVAHIAGAGDEDTEAAQKQEIRQDEDCNHGTSSESVEEIDEDNFEHGLHVDESEDDYGINDLEDFTLESSEPDCTRIHRDKEIAEANAMTTSARLHELDSSEAKSNGRARRKMTRIRSAEETDEIRKFNPLPPRLLLVQSDPQAEKVDLRHQMMDERKIAKDWMIDYALQQTVTRLTPARKRKVELLVEAFETVVPLTMQDLFKLASKS